MKKQIMDLEVLSLEQLNERNVLLKLHCPIDGEILAGQFVEVRIDNQKDVFLRRPISVHYYSEESHELWLLVQLVGKGTRAISMLEKGTKINLVLPLGNGFSLPEKPQKTLLVGGGVGVAPLLYLGKKLKEKGNEVTFLLGARTSSDLMQIACFKEFGEVCITTEDASEGESGFVTQHSIWGKRQFDKIFSCGPTPMMKAVAKMAQERNIDCEVSLENTMACGLGACLCCVTDTKEGHKCVCTDGPVFDIKELKW